MKILGQIAKNKEQFSKKEIKKGVACIHERVNVLK